jgi:hypothetical protein
MQDSNETSGDSLNNMRHEVSRISGIRNGNIRKAKLASLTINRQNIRDMYKGIREFKT